MVKIKNVERILTISDVHGEYEKFINLLEIIKYNSEKDLLVLLGDYIDRGSEPIKVLQKVMDLSRNGAIVLKGNHEEMFQMAEREGNKSEAFEIHLNNGGVVTWDKFLNLTNNEQKKILEFISNLKYGSIIEDYMFVHAGIRPGGYEQDTNDLLWIRNDFLNHQTGINEVIIFGHTVTKTINGQCNIWNGGDKIGIDCGCVYGGRLACLELPSMKEYYV